MGDGLKLKRLNVQHRDTRMLDQLTGGGGTRHRAVETGGQDSGTRCSDLEDRERRTA